MPSNRRPGPIVLGVHGRLLPPARADPSRPGRLCEPRRLAPCAEQAPRLGRTAVLTAVLVGLGSAVRKATPQVSNWSWLPKLPRVRMGVGGLVNGGTGRPSQGCRIRRRLSSVSTSQDIAQFLTSRRARITPEQAGLPSYGARRMPSLRREEVAALAGWGSTTTGGWSAGASAGSPTACSRLSHGRCSSMMPSAHLFDLARAVNPTVPTRRRPVQRRIRPALQRVLDTMGAPALVGRDPTNRNTACRSPTAASTRTKGPPTGSPATA
jgi:hypothetical protein